jgi:hypothetical protein
MMTAKGKWEVKAKFLWEALELRVAEIVAGGKLRG